MLKIIGTTHQYLRYLLVLISAFSIGCSFPKKSYSFIPPVGMTKERKLAVGRECLREAQKLTNTPLTEDESHRIGDIETGRFSEGGRGRSKFSDHYFLCFLNKNFQLLEFPTNWFNESSCEILSKYQSAGIEKERLKDLCKTKYSKQCDACQSLQ